MPKTPPPEPNDFDPLSKRQIERLKKQIADSKDPTRYVIVSPMLRDWCFFYLPADAVYLVNRIEPGCFFKRKAEAQAVAKLLNGSKRKKNTQVIAVRKTKNGVRILDQVIDPDNPQKRWKPKLHRSRAPFAQASKGVKTLDSRLTLKA
jgi:hypothetical protein